MKIIQLAIRTLLRFRLYTAINILGLALSLACGMTIARYAYRELTANHFVKDLDRVYLTGGLEGSTYRITGITGAFKNDAGFIDPLNSPIVEKSTSFVSFTDDNILVDQQKFNACVFAIDSNFLKILNFPLVQGTVETVISDPQNAVITRKFAKKIFGDQDPMGKTLTHSCGKPVTITGVVDEPGTKSSIRFDLLVSSKLQKHWARISYTLLVTYPGVNIDVLNKQLPHIDGPNSKKQYKFFPLSDFYFDRSVSFFDMPDAQGNYTHVIILLIVAFLVLIVGVFNFVNIYTVLMLKRAREFGMKKVFGSNSLHMIRQLFAENLVMIGIAVIAGWAFIEITADLAEQKLGIPQVSHSFFDFILSFSILIILPAITSIYPFIRYNYATPISSLKSVNMGGNSIVSRTLFLVMQYIITFSLIVIALFFVKQLKFMLNTDLGFRTENIVKVQFHKMELHFIPSIEERKAIEAKKDREVTEIKQRINASPLFTGWYYGESPNKLMIPCLNLKTPNGKFKETAYASLPEEAFKIYDFKLKEGRLWNDSIDNEQNYNFIINETAQKLFGFTSLDSAFLQTEFRLWSNPETDSSQNPPYRIVGVIEDFKGTHLSKSTPPLVISFSEGWSCDKLTVAIAKGKKQEAIAFLKKLHDDTVGGEFEYSLLENEIESMYRQDKQVATIYSTFALIAILISSLGLFGLSLFDVQQRYREIALRKVNGAQVKDIMMLLLRKYFLLLSLSFVIAVPFSYIAIYKYLEGFANKAPISWWIFAIAAILTATVSLGTLIFQIRKAANGNPATILKSE